MFKVVRNHYVIKKMYFQVSKSFVPVVNLVKVACLVFPGSRGASRS